MLIFALYFVNGGGWTLLTEFIRTAIKRFLHRFLPLIFPITAASNNPSKISLPFSTSGNWYCSNSSQIVAISFFLTILIFFDSYLLIIIEKKACLHCREWEERILLFRFGLSGNGFLICEKRNYLISLIQKMAHVLLQ
jgi:hypothetical protein